ncbi:MAG: hypothetical protein U1F36_09335 [Planctomycetota bacterium]
MKCGVDKARNHPAYVAGRKPRESCELAGAACAAFDQLQNKSLARSESACVKKMVELSHESDPVREVLLPLVGIRPCQCHVELSEVRGRWRLEPFLVPSPTSVASDSEREGNRIDNRIRARASSDFEQGFLHKVIDLLPANPPRNACAHGK